jgi:hypothetical protein
MDLLRLSIAVKIPTRAIIPNAIIEIVSTVLSLLVLTVCKATLRFSRINNQRIHALLKIIHKVNAF